jgi:hypothetical protein
VSTAAAIALTQLLACVRWPIPGAEARDGMSTCRAPRRRALKLMPVLI